LLALLITTVTPVLAAAGQSTPSGLSFEEMEIEIDTLIDGHIGTSTPGAAIVVVHEGEIIFSRGYGFADIENRIHVDPETTVFGYGSINKLLVWVAVMQMVEQGLLDLDADIERYLPESFEFEHPFTMRDLMNHTAGFAEGIIGITFTGDYLPALEEGLLNSQPKQLFVPGTASGYSNWGTGLAAFVVSEVSGQNFADYERENIMIPSNMQNSLNLPDWFGNDGFLDYMAQGYRRDEAYGFISGGDTLSLTFYPTGNLRGTAESLAGFIKALTPTEGESGPLFEHAETLERLLSSSSLDPINRPTTYHGFFPYSGVLPSFGHMGGLSYGFTADFAFVPETRFGYVILTNAADEFNLIPSIGELLLGGVQVPAAGSNLPDVEAVEGRYIVARRLSGNFLEFFNYVGLMPGFSLIRAFDENKIQLEFGGIGSAVYVQTEPYVFHIYDWSDSPIMLSIIPQFRFLMEDGAPLQIIAANGVDFTPLPEGRTMPFLVLSHVILILSVLFFFIAPVALFIVFLIRHKKQKPRTRFDSFSTFFLLSGVLLLLNNLALFLMFGINPMRSAPELAPFIWINYVLTGLTAILFLGSIFSWRTSGEKRAMRKVFFLTTTLITASFIFLLYSWNFFVLL